eukprot:CAMPEP_0119316844 /NCGR_PEP_ID=MMETSP1333-20130426/41088_1 /TAXON_ID=418940 /ORGANISM="Scyphosphaera apsteinii, Strain RCC1455" /LENGTH=91 /DNA_ID=CAMNT_0007322605 /DNA_START=102 /DNA_END=374 /DNA_ORIENTATION=+
MRMQTEDGVLLSSSTTSGCSAAGGLARSTATASGKLTRARVYMTPPPRATQQPMTAWIDFASCRKAMPKPMTMNLFTFASNMNVVAVTYAW